jgi:hypothetical protein
MTLFESQHKSIYHPYDTKKNKVKINHAKSSCWVTRQKPLLIRERLKVPHIKQNYLIAFVFYFQFKLLI